MPSKPGFRAPSKRAPLERWSAALMAALFAILTVACSGGGDSDGVTLAPVAPQITTAPVSQRVMQGVGVTFTVVATGSAPLHYQWQQNGSNVGSDAATYSISSAQFTDAGSYTVTVTNAVSSVTCAAATLSVDPIDKVDLPGCAALKLVSIPAGSFTMGLRGLVGAEPPHTVTLSAFYMAKCETTQAQWLAVMGNNPSEWPADLRHPVEHVSYDDITAPTTGFLDKLNAATAAARPKGLVFRLPTEAEWEYACRAGTTTDYYWDWREPIANYAWYYGNSGGKTHPVGEKLPNAWGLHDMIGNVWEWCQDWYGDYPSDSVTDPAGPASGTSRTSRGASWSDDSDYCSSPNRGGSSPDARGGFQGFRVVLANPRTP